MPIITVTDDEWTAITPTTDPVTVVCTKGDVELHIGPSGTPDGNNSLILSALDSMFPRTFDVPSNSGYALRNLYGHPATVTVIEADYVP
jgi:hypothetical protein